MDETLVKIKQFAAEAHKGQKRKYTDEPYIVHPIKVMETCSMYTSDIAVLGAALLHDVLEDTEITAEELQVFLQSVMEEESAADCLRYTVELTDVFVKARYPQWNRRQRKRKELERLARISGNAQTVKYADIIDNSREISNHDKQFSIKLLREYKAVLKVLTRGMDSLRVEAIKSVDFGLAGQEKFPVQRKQALNPGDYFSKL